MIRRPPRSTQSRSSAASDVYKRQGGGFALRAARRGRDAAVRMEAHRRAGGRAAAERAHRRRGCRPDHAGRMDGARLQRRRQGITTMALKVAFQMDPIELIDIKGDSTFALLLEAQSRGHDVFYYTPADLSLRDGKLMAYGQSLTVEDKPGDHYRLAYPRAEDLAGYDVVQLRQDPPFDMAYIT